RLQRRPCRAARLGAAITRRPLAHRHRGPPAPATADRGNARNTGGGGPTARPRVARGGVRGRAECAGARRARRRADGRTAAAGLASELSTGSPRRGHLGLPGYGASVITCCEARPLAL